MYRSVIVLLTFFTLSCGTSGPEAESPSPLRLTFLNVQVKHIYDQSSGLDSVVPNTTILVYNTEADRQDSINIVSSAETDSAGKAEFFYTVKLGAENYGHFIKIAHPSLGIKLYTIATPPGATTQLGATY